MAEAKRTKTKIVKEIPAVQLTLTEGEADFLIALLARVGGHRVSSPRKYGDSICVALTNAAGFSYKDTDAFPLTHGSITCDEYPVATRRRYA